MPTKMENLTKMNCRSSSRRSSSYTVANQAMLGPIAMAAPAVVQEVLADAEREEAEVREVLALAEQVVVIVRVDLIRNLNLSSCVNKASMHVR